MTTVRESERIKYDDLAAQWHDGVAFRTLKAFTPLRVRFIKDAILKGCVKPGLPPTMLEKHLSGFRVLDVGCGGGLISEALAKEGAQIVGIDISEKAIEYNKQRVVESGNEELKRIHYATGAVERLVAQRRARMDSAGSVWGWLYEFLCSSTAEEELAKQVPKEGFDVVVASEVLEHVDRPRLFLKSLDELLKPQGLLVVTTPNRTPVSKFSLIYMGERIMRLLPVGIHDWSWFVKPRELDAFLSHRDIPKAFSPLAWLTGRRDRFLVESPLATDKGRERIAGRYSLVDRSGIFLWPGRLWTKFPLKWIGYMAAYKKQASD